MNSSYTAKEGKRGRHQLHRSQLQEEVGLPPNFSAQTTTTRITATTITQTYAVVANGPTKPNAPPNLEAANVLVPLKTLLALKFPGNLENLGMKKL
jgi:hypothetical protein